MSDFIHRSDIINLIIKTFGYKTYLEIGVDDTRNNFDNIEVDVKHGVDPVGHGLITYKMTSDEFFAQNKNKYDIIFVDGLHHDDQVTKDINNALDCLSDNGTILVHDCNPKEEKDQLIPFDPSHPHWLGNVWKAWVRLRQTLPTDIEMFVIEDEEAGLGIIKTTYKGILLDPIAEDQLIYDNLNLNRTKWLNLVSFEDFTAKLLKKERKVCMTAITGGYDTIIENQANLDDTKFICFSDDSDLESNLWDVRPVCNDFDGFWDAAVRNAKRHKVMIHEYVYCDYSLWIDGFVRLTKPVSYIISAFADDDHDIWMFKHPVRDCAYEEMNVCAEVKLGIPALIQEQHKKYKDEGFPSNYGLHAGGIILRRHTDKIKKFNCIWWNEICKYSKRDQLSLDYSAWKAGIKIGLIDEVWRSSSFCRVGLHAKPFNHPRIETVNDRTL